MRVAEQRNAHGSCVLVLGIYMFLYVLHCPAPVVVRSHGQERQVPAEHGVARHPLLGLMARLEGKIARRVQEMTHAVEGVADGAAKRNHLRLELGALL